MFLQHLRIQNWTIAFEIFIKMDQNARQTCINSLSTGDLLILFDYLIGYDDKRSTMYVNK